MTLADLRRAAELLPAGASLTLPCEALRDLLATIPAAEVKPIPPAVTAASAATWREKLWTAPPDTRLGVRETAEALGRPVSFVYRGTSEKASAGDRIPHRKLAGELTFVVGELRSWIRDHEETITAGRLDRAIMDTSPMRRAR